MLFLNIFKLECQESCIPSRFALWDHITADCSFPGQAVSQLGGAKIVTFLLMSLLRDTF